MINVLWFAGNPALYASSQYNGGGWIGALQRELVSTRGEEIRLHIAFPWTENIKNTKDNVVYYGIKKIEHAFYQYKKKENKQLELMKNVIADCHPDIIHVFGTEAIYGLVSTITEIPVVIHLQGILTAIFESWMPQNLSWSQYILRRPGMFLGYWGQFKLIRRERTMFEHCTFFMGRTIWDKRLLNLLSPSSSYHYCSEMLRPEIYHSEHIWAPQHHHKARIMSVISGAVYKGADVILRTANVLKIYFSFDFEWYVYGVNDLSLPERITGIKASDVNVVAAGIVNANELVSSICNSDIFVHPSYIENSPNSVCEAQVLGIPLIATHVGGCESIVEHEKTGIIVPPNDIYMMASQIKRLLSDIQFCKELSTSERRVALERHNPQTIVSDLISIYKSIINE